MSRFFKAKEYNETFTVDILLESFDYHDPVLSLSRVRDVLSKVFAKMYWITGDVRAESWWTLSLIKNPHLFPYITGLKTLDQIYLDTTFSYRGEPYIYHAQ